MNSTFSSSSFTSLLSSSAVAINTRIALGLIISTFVLSVTIINSLRQKNIQGLPCWPIVGMLPSLIVGYQIDLYEWISEFLCRVNRSFIFKGPWFSSVHFAIVWDPRNLEYLLKTKFSNFPKGSFFKENVHDLLGDGILNADGDNWSNQRKMASIEMFNSSKFRDLTTGSLVELVHSRLLPHLEYSVRNSLLIDLQDLLLRTTFDNVCMIAFGVDPCSLDANGLRESQFAQAFQDATELTALRFVMPTCMWKLMRYFNLGTEGRLKESIRIVKEFVEQVIQQRRKELETEKSDLLTILMRLQHDDDAEKVSGKAYSDVLLRDICVNFILAGRDSSSVAMSWFFLLIYQNPAVEEKILEEIMKIVGDRDEQPVNKDKMVFSADEVKRMEYLHAALTESLRLYPPVPLDFKQAAEDDIFPDGTIIKKGAKVIYSIYSMGRMEVIWGKDCREYKPERWLKNGVFTSESAYKFTAFNGGPRLCLGKEFAYYQMKFVVASIMYRFSIKVAENHVVVPKVALTLYIKHGLKVNLYKRS